MSLFSCPEKHREGSSAWPMAKGTTITFLSGSTCPSPCIRAPGGERHPGSPTKTTHVSLGGAGMPSLCTSLTLQTKHRHCTAKRKAEGECVYLELCICLREDSLTREKQFCCHWGMWMHFCGWANLSTKLNTQLTFPEIHCCTVTLLAKKNTHFINPFASLVTTARMEIKWTLAAKQGNLLTTHQRICQKWYLAAECCLGLTGSLQGEWSPLKNCQLVL